LCVIPDEESTTIMRRRLTIAEREELAAERARRQQELLDEAAALRGSIAERAQVCARLAQRDRRRPTRERIGAQVERLSAAQLALDLALRLLQVDDPDRQPIVSGEAQPSVRELHTQLSERLGRWYRAGEGWWEARIVWRPRIQVVRDPETTRATIEVMWYPFGPYYYRHWRQDGKQQTKYLGRDRPNGFPVEEDIELPAPEPSGEVGWLVMEARELAQHLQDELDAAPVKSRRAQRLQRVLRRALQRAQRRLRGEVREREGERRIERDADGVVSEMTVFEDIRC
jgi:hypothetical protein